MFLDAEDVPFADYKGAALSILAQQLVALKFQSTRQNLFSKKSKNCLQSDDKSVIITNVAL